MKQKEFDFETGDIKYRINSQFCSKCGITVGNRKTKYCGDGSDKDNEHRWVTPSGRAVFNATN